MKNSVSKALIFNRERDEVGWVGFQIHPLGLGLISKRIHWVGSPTFLLGLGCMGENTLGWAGWEKTHWVGSQTLLLGLGWGGLQKTHWVGLKTQENKNYFLSCWSVNFS